MMKKKEDRIAIRLNFHYNPAFQSLNYHNNHSLSIQSTKTS